MLREELEQSGYTVEEEYALGGGATADLRAEKEGKVTFVEVETGRSDIAANITKYDDRDERLIVFFTNDDAAAGYRDLVMLQRPATHCVTPRDLESIV